MTFTIVAMLMAYTLQGFSILQKQEASLPVFNLPVPAPKKKTTLDSLQGKWTSVDDPKNHIKISGRAYEEYYEKISKEYFRLYFSDTIVDNLNFSFTNIRIDTSKLTGNYMIARDMKSPDEFWCWEINGFIYSRSGTTLSVSDTWAKYRPTLFKKDRRK